MKNNYQIKLERIHHSECFINYKDALGELKIWADESPSPEYDFVSAEPEFGVTGDRLSQVIENIYEWANSNNLIIKIWKKYEIG